jgi:energy-coupling factor transporter ATP-binding protein EcfA2
MKINFDSNLFVNELEVKGDLELKSGLNVLSGRNGLGKSTLFNFIKNNRNKFFENEKLSFMDQFPLMPLSELRVQDLFNILVEDISYFDIKKSNELLDFFKFNSLLTRSVNLLSGGENQILKFILASSQKTNFYFFDEPLQYLDGENLKKVIDEIKNLSTSSTVVVIEHRKEHLSHLDVNWIEMVEDGDSILVGAKSGI